MAKTASEFLTDLAQRELVAPNIVASLRRQVGEAAKPVSAATVAKLLVEKGHLTAAQAERLLGAGLATTRPSPAKRPELETLAETKPMESELGLTPLVDDAASVVKPQPTPAAGPTLEPLDLELLDLVPLDDLAASTGPKGNAAPPAKTPAFSSDKPPPTAHPLTPLSTPPALSPLTPLEPLAPHLPPLDTLAPLDLAQPLVATPAAVPRSNPPLSHPSTKPPPQPRPTDRSNAALLPAAEAPRPTTQPARSSRWMVWAGGLALALVMLVGGVGGTLLLLKDGEKVGDPFELAEQEYQAGRYAAAAEKYTALLQDSPRHEKSGVTRIHRGISQILAVKGSTDDPSALLAIARQALAEIDREPQLAEIHAQLAPLLTEMADQLRMRAEGAPAAELANHLAEAQDALALANNGRYVPGNLRDWQRLSQVAESLEVLERDLARRQAIDKCQASMGKLLESGDLNAARAQRDKLLTDYPELAGDAKLQEWGQAFARIAASAVGPVADLAKAQGEEAPSSIIARITPRHRQAGASRPGGVLLAHAAGAVWAMDSSDGRILWSRQLGGAVGPVPLSQANDSDVILVDVRRNVVMRIVPTSGEVRWRHGFPSTLAGPPLVAGEQIVVATRDGRITALAMQSGDAVAACQLPEAAHLGPVASPDGKRLFQLASRDLLFVLSAVDLSCQRAVFLGHVGACVDVPLLVTPDRLVVSENYGEQATLRLVPLDGSGLPTTDIRSLQVSGQVVTPPVVRESRLLVLTDQGELVVLAFPTDPEKSPTQIAKSSLQVQSPLMHFGLAAGNRLAIAGLGLSLVDVPTKDGEVRRQWTAFPGMAMEPSLQIHGEAVLCVRRAAGGVGWTAAAVGLSDGKALWETDLAAPLDEVSLLDGGKSARLVSALGAAASVELAALQGEVVIDVVDDPALRLPSLPDALASQPARVAGGLLAPCQDGCIYWLKAGEMEPAGRFQMRIEVGSSLERAFVAPIEIEGRRFIAGDGAQSLYHLELLEDSGLTQLAAARLDTPLASPLAVLKDRAFGVDQAGNLLSLTMPDLQPVSGAPLTVGRPTWGPYALADWLLIATDRQELVAIGGAGALRWRITAPEAPFVGNPVELAGKVIVATPSGLVLVFSADTGEELARIDLEQPLLGNMVLLEDHVLVSAADGSLLKVSLRQPEGGR